MAIFIKKVEFVTSIASIKVYQEFCQTYDCPEICVVGRSNVGKSSFLNMIAGRKIAKTSSTPGRTRLINVFSVNDGQCMLIDLPGYGYAKASKQNQKEWGALIEEYLNTSQKLTHVFSLVDSRHSPSDKDKQMLEFLYHTGLPFTVIATKADKLSRAEESRNIQKIATQLSIGKDNIIVTSAENKKGKDKTEQKLFDIIQNFNDADTDTDDDEVVS